MSPGTEFDRNRMMLTQTSQRGYEDLCKLDVLGLADVSEHDQSRVYAEFKEQLTRLPVSWYETGLPWKPNHTKLLNDKEGSLLHLASLTKQLERKGQTDEYNAIIQKSTKCRPKCR